MKNNSGVIACITDRVSPKGYTYSFTNIFTIFVRCAFSDRNLHEDAIGSHTCSLEANMRETPMEFLSEVHSSYRLAL
jgi:hypothetical protein